MVSFVTPLARTLLKPSHNWTTIKLGRPQDKGNIHNAIVPKCVKIRRIDKVSDMNTLVDN